MTKTAQARQQAQADRMLRLSSTRAKARNAFTAAIDSGEINSLDFIVGKYQPKK